MRASWVPGAACWVRDQERAFAEGTVQSVTKGVANVVVLGLEGESSAVERSVNVDELLPRTLDQRCVAEMDDLQELHMASVLHNVHLLFGREQCANPGEGPSTIYSSVGPVLIAMNPFVPLPIYTEQWVQAYRRASGDERASRALGPHCYRTVEEAYARLRAARCQSVVICGESGAGKTVTNRKMLEYICQVAKRKGTSKAAPVGADPQQITEANVLLESFGNAKTTRNNNSSRFGKYTKLTFDASEGYTICGCHVDHYLLERSRVVSQPPQERNYHVFYQLLRSGSGKKYGLTEKAEDYKYTRDGAAISGFCDAEDYRDVCQAMGKAGFSEPEQGDVFESIAAVLHLGNVDFTGDIDQSQVDPATMPALTKACELLGVPKEALSKALTHAVMKVPSGASINKVVSKEVARGQLDTVAKTIYSRLFDHIVSVIGYRLRRTRTRQKSFDRQGSYPEVENASIGLLDIFGFEDMPINGFEQLFINLTNERIQHLFNSIMFEREIEAYRREGIENAFDPGPGNLECVKLITSQHNPPGIVRLLSESAMMKSGRDDAAFVQVLNSSFALHPNFKVCDPQDAQRVAKSKGLKTGSRGGFALDYRECFQVRHYAGTVMYTVKGWVPKSLDSLLPHLNEVMSQSSKQHIRDRFSQEDAVGKATLGEKFSAQLEVLAGTLEEGETSFVRCIKSNLQMVPGLVNRPFVLEQLIHGGVISALEMRHRGLPDRMDYASFCEEYSLLENSRQQAFDEKTRCERVMRDVFPLAGKDGPQYAFGHTKVFMRSHVAAFLRAIVSLRTRNMTKRVQRRWRLHMGTQLIRKIDEAWEKFQEASALAKAKGVDGLPGVAKALQESESRIKPMVKLLEEARSTHGSNVHKIAASLPAERISPLHGAAEAVDTAVNRVVQRKQQAEELLYARLTRAMDSSRKLLGRVEALEVECKEMADEVEAAERESWMAACKAARARLEAFQSKDLPELRRKGPAGVDLEAEGDISEMLNAKGVGPFSAVQEKVEQATKLVLEAEQLGHLILRVRRAFQQAVEEVQGKHEAAQSALEALQEPARRCVAEGLDGIVGKINVAWQREADAREVLEAAKDADGYRAAVEAFVAAVKEAEDAVERGREELAKREAEKEERRELQAQLDAVLAQLKDRWDGLHRNLQVRMAGTASAAQAARGTLEPLLEEISALRGRSTTELAIWRAEVESVVTRARAASAEVDSAINEVTKARQEEFNRRKNIFSSPQKEADESIVDPEEFLQQEGLSSHKETLLEMVRLMQTLQEAGVPRSKVQRSLNHFVKHLWSSPAPHRSPPRGDGQVSTPKGGTGKAAMLFSPDKR